MLITSCSDIKLISVYFEAAPGLFLSSISSKWRIFSISINVLLWMSSYEQEPNSGKKKKNPLPHIIFQMYVTGNMFFNQYSLV